MDVVVFVFFTFIPLLIIAWNTPRGHKLHAVSATLSALGGITGLLSVSGSTSMKNYGLSVAVIRSEKGVWFGVAYITLGLVFYLLGLPLKQDSHSGK